MSRVLSRPMIGLWFMLIMLPVFFNVAPIAESHLFPVSTRLEVSRETKSSEGVSFYVRFEKLRRCEFRGVSWYRGDVRLTVDFEPSAALSPRSRPTGPQYSGPWLLRGVETVRGTNATVHHRCHPLWETLTRFFP